MLYDYHYDLAAIGISFVLLMVYNFRRTYRTKSLHFFILLMVFNMVSAIFDAISCFTISYPQDYPLWLNYVASLGYLFFYNSMSVLFYRYIDSKAKIAKLKNVNRVFGALMMAFYFVTIFSSPWTHWVAYFDSNGRYYHGPLFVIYYFLPYIIFLLEILMFIVARKRFNRYQVIASVSMIVGMSVSVLVSILIPRALIGQLAMSVIMFFIYVAYENPAHYTYKDTQCLNRAAFLNFLSNYKKVNKSIGMIGFRIQDFAYIRRNRGEKLVEKLSGKIAEFLYRRYKMKAFALSDSTFVVFYESEAERLSIKQIIREYFVFPFSINKDTIKVNINLVDIPELDYSYSIEDLESFVEYRMSHPEEDSDSTVILNTLITDRQYKEQLLHVIKRAIDNNEFQVYYQPIYNSRTGHFESAEALIRLIDDDLGFINPEELITMAEENGCIDQIGELVFRKVCSFMRKSSLQELGVHYVEINLSPKQCLQPNLASTYQSIMQIYKIDPKCINLEITETAEVTTSQSWLVAVSRLHAIGVEFSIDDYGSGFASADYLIKIPVSIVKIDKTILWQAMEDPQAMIILKHTIHMLKDLGKKIVVEGVENEEMIAVLKENNVDYLQGFYYSRPIPEGDYIEFLKDHNK